MRQLQGRRYSVERSFELEEGKASPSQCQPHRLHIRCR